MDPSAPRLARLKRLARSLGRTSLGKQVVYASVLDDPEDLRLANVDSWPPSLRGFEDLAFLFSSNQLNHGVAALQFDEAALLYRLARDARSGPVVEIGRFKGGSTIVLAAGLPDGVELWSYDLHIAPHPRLRGEQLDGELRGVLERYGLAAKVHLVVGDSRTVEPPPDAPEVVFLDGDHTYDGVRADFTRWGALVRPGGHLLFHDAVDSGGWGNAYRGVARAVAELDRNSQWARRPGAGSIAHFVKR